MPKLPEYSEYPETPKYPGQLDSMNSYKQKQESYDNDVRLYNQSVQEQDANFSMGVDHIEHIVKKIRQRIPTLKIQTHRLRESAARLRHRRPDL
jgi:hypothetical protein